MTSWTEKFLYTQYNQGWILGEVKEAAVSRAALFRVSHLVIA